MNDYKSLKNAYNNSTSLLTENFYPTSGCPAGTYCPKPKKDNVCPAGYYCQSDTFLPKKCGPGFYCPENSLEPTACPYDMPNTFTMISKSIDDCQK